tara:strand:+ start:1657 stop:2415 length:759 start_codon:yes stop_codon:yes gene_type:complete
MHKLVEDVVDCKVCGADSFIFDVCDFGKSCVEADWATRPRFGIPVYYYRCSDCGLLFTRDFDHWSVKEFQRYIYNDEYEKVDPSFADERPRSFASLIDQKFGDHRQTLRMLDYGSGNGRMTELLQKTGWTDAKSYDPVYPEFQHPPDGLFDLITAIEVVEHSPTPLETIQEIANFLKPGGLILLGTMLQPADIEKRRLSWWYVGPRNGHITLFSRKSMEIAWAGCGLEFGSAGENLHSASKGIPDFAAHLFC